jgi:predicted ABC-type ATPase
VQSTGYKFHLVYLWLPIVELAIARVEERVRRGGHAIPEAVIRRRYDRSLDNFFNIYVPFADSWLMLDNSLEPRPRAVAKRATKRGVRVVDVGWWTALRVKYERQNPDES